MDPLSDVLSLLKPRSYVSAGFEAGGAWSVRFSRQQGYIKCYAVIAGEAWLAVEGEAAAVRLVAGEGFVLPTGRSFRLASDLSLPPVEAATIFPPRQAGGVVTLNGGGDFALVGSRFAVSARHADALLGTLPTVMHIRKKSDQAALRWSVERMMEELRERQPGGFLIAQHLAHMMLVQALRLQLEDGPRSGVGWFYALADRRLSEAIGALHEAPSQRWTLQQLARHAGMSRSAFALRFRKTVGLSPMEYLTRWRMLLAGERLTAGAEPLSVISQSLGYESESAFGTAFKRVMGCSPRRYGRQGRGGEAPALTPTVSAAGDVTKSL